MESIYYIASDNSIMLMEDFIPYVCYLKRAVISFNFAEWFCDEDFSDVEAYNYLKNLFQK